MKLKYSSWEQINLQTYNEIKKIGRKRCQAYAGMDA